MTTSPSPHKKYVDLSQRETATLYLVLHISLRTITRAERGAAAFHVGGDVHLFLGGCIAFPKSAARLPASRCGDLSSPPLLYRVYLVRPTNILQTNVTLLLLTAPTVTAL